MNILILAGFQIILSTGPLLCCLRTRRKLSVKKIVPLPLTPLEKHKNEYKHSLQKWGQPTPSLTYHVPSLNCTLCGRRDIDETVHSIIHGQPVPDKFYPWQVYLNNSRIFCGGTLIASQWVLTAAHCITGQVSTLMGTSNRVNYSSHAVVRVSDKEIIHEKFSSKSTSNDIALIKLDRPVMFNSYIKPICLPGDIIQFNESHECYETGWGQIGPDESPTSAQLQEIKVQIMRFSKCFYAQWALERKVRTPTQLCTKLDKALPNAGGCFGDSGGPLSCRVGHQFFLAGIVSLVQTNCRKTIHPDLFVKVSYYRNWIMQTILANGGT